MIIMKPFRIWLWKKYKIIIANLKDFPREEENRIKQEYALSEGNCMEDCFSSLCATCSLHNDTYGPLWDEEEINVNTTHGTAIG